MNYLKEINAFYDRIETNPLSSAAVTLWHALMHTNNKAGWIKEFAVAVSVLCTKTGLSERLISKARSELKQKGYIEFHSQKGNRPALYRLCGLALNSFQSYSSNQGGAIIGQKTDNCSTNLTEKVSGNHSDKCTDNLADKNGRGNPTKKFTEKHSDKYTDNDSDKRSTLLNKTKQNKTVASNSLCLYEAFEKSFNRIPTPMQIDILTSFIDQDELSEELVVYGLSIAGEKGKPFSYAKSILTNWCKQKIHTVEEAKAHNEQYRQRKNNISTFPIQGGSVNEINSKQINGSAYAVTNFKFYK